MGESYRVYVSSTYQDLQEHRKAVYTALHKLECVEKVVAMEDYVASDQRPLDKCLSDVEAAHIYVGIFAWRYGFTPPSEQNPARKSITELEFGKAKASGKHCLIFVLDENAPWKRSFMDEVTGENDTGTRIKALRQDLLEHYLASKFSDAQELAALVNAAVANLAATHRSAGEEQGAASESTPQVRELRNAFYLAHSPIDEALAKPLALSLGAGVQKPVLLSRDALFADDAAGFEALDHGITRCHAALVLVSPASYGQLQARASAVSAVLEVMHARTGAVAALLAGVPRANLPPEWTFDEVFELPAPEPGSGVIPDSTLTTTKQWIDARMPPFGVRTVGVPVALLAMTKGELSDLEIPGFIADRLGKPAEEQYRRLTDALAESKIPWTQRYDVARVGWRPFVPEGRALTTILEEIVNELNRRALRKLKHRHLRLQWYPFDAVLRGDDRLRRMYRDVAKTGLVMVVDEVSLFHPELRQAFQNSPFFNNDQVAIVTISPFDPAGALLNQLLETETRRKLAGAFDRYAIDYDPQCELAVGDERRLKRWLHASLPETVTRLQELQPDRDAMRAFFGQEPGGDSLRPKGDYLWASGGRP